MRAGSGRGAPRRPALSQTAEYALRAVLHLAAAGPERAVGVGAMAAALRIPASYLSKTLQSLVTAGVLRSARGRSGGFRLARAPERLRLIDIVEPFDEAGHGRFCLLGGECTERRACAAHRRWKPAAEVIAEFFGTTTVADLI